MAARPTISRAFGLRRPAYRLSPASIASLVAMSDNKTAISRARLELGFEDGTPIKDRYRVVSRLGEGGQGIVYKAVDLREGNETRAVKVLFCDSLEKREEGSEALSRFAAEYAILRKLVHPNIVRVCDSGQVPDAYYFIAMEYVPGGTLFALLNAMRKKTVSPLSFSEVLRILHQLASGLAAAHEAGVIHRDLKPANVLLTSDGRVKILDFGLARDMKQGLTLTAVGNTVGTIAYMSPEQLTRAIRLDCRTDIYSLGILAYELASGRHPFALRGLEQATDADVTQSHLQDPVPPFQATGFDAPAWFEEFVLICTEKKRARRYDSAAEIVRYLERRMAEMGMPDIPANDESIWLRTLSRLVFGNPAGLSPAA